MLQTNNPALIIIDVQDAIDQYSQKKRNNQNAEKVISSLLAVWRKNKLPIVHVRHSSKFKESPYHKSSQFFKFKNKVAPMEKEHIITKQENCAFINTHLEFYLKERNISELIVCGVLTNNSVDVTVRIASSLGFKVYVPHDATASFGMDLLNGKSLTAEDIHWVYLSNLNGEYCNVCSSEQLLEQKKLKNNTRILYEKNEFMLI